MAKAFPEASVHIYGDGFKNFYKNDLITTGIVTENSKEREDLPRLPFVGNHLPQKLSSATFFGFGFEYGKHDFSELFDFTAIVPIQQYLDVITRVYREEAGFRSESPKERTTPTLAYYHRYWGINQYQFRSEKGLIEVILKTILSQTRGINRVLFRRIRKGRLGAALANRMTRVEDGVRNELISRGLETVDFGDYVNEYFGVEKDWASIPMDALLETGLLQSISTHVVLDSSICVPLSFTCPNSTIVIGADEESLRKQATKETFELVSRMSEIYKLASNHFINNHSELQLAFPALHQTRSKRENLMPHVVKNKNILVKGSTETPE